VDLSGWGKVDEIPYDFDRRRLSVIVQKEGGEILIVKGAVPEMLSICSEIEWKGGDREALSPERKEEIEHYFEQASKSGLRTLAVGYSEGREEKDLHLLGFLHFQDPIKKDIASVVSALKSKGIQFKIITGDHHFVALHVAGHLGLSGEHLIRGAEIGDAKEENLLSLIRDKNVFAEIEPHQKENIILALRKSGCVVGFLGDGINDISALHSADVGISVDKGADAAKEASDFVLLHKNLSVLLAGVEEGRHTFANTIKYVYMAVSANFGNMFSMAGASLFLPFLPLLPKQVLLTNLLTDIPEMAIASDRVDADLIHRPVKWDLKFICKFMIVFGLISSIFDYLTFGLLFFWMQASEIEFRTGWFIESVASAAIVALILRTRHWFFSSRPGNLLTIAVGAVVVIASLLPLTPLGVMLGFTPLPAWFYGAVFALVLAYLGLVELAKRIFFRKNIRKHHGSDLS
jgi:Mg2+-importing ATPase